jgi:hypothetical protein
VHGIYLLVGVAANLPGVLGEVDHIGARSNCEVTRFCLGQMSNRKNSGFLRQIEHHLPRLEARQTPYKPSGPYLFLVLNFGRE